MPRLYLIRHGSTDWNLEHRLQGQPTPDISLNDTGRAQAQTIAAHLQAHNITFDHIYSSPLARAAQTAAIISAATQIPRSENDDLKEMFFGDYEGYTSADFKAVTFADGTTGHDLRTRHKSLDVQYDDTRHPGGESKSQVKTRLNHAFADILTHTDTAALLVMHNAAFRIVMSQWNTTQAAEPLDHTHILIADFAPISDNGLRLLNADRIRL